MNFQCEMSSNSTPSILWSFHLQHQPTMPTTLCLTSSREGPQYKTATCPAKLRLLWPPLKRRRSAAIWLSYTILARRLDREPQAGLGSESSIWSADHPLNGQLNFRCDAEETFDDIAPPVSVLCDVSDASAARISGYWHDDLAAELEKHGVQFVIEDKDSFMAAVMLMIPIM